MYVIVHDLKNQLYVGKIVEETLFPEFIHVQEPICFGGSSCFDEDIDLGKGEVLNQWFNRAKLCPTDLLIPKTHIMRIITIQDSIANKLYHTFHREPNKTNVFDNSFTEV